MIECVGRPLDRVGYPFVAVATFCCAAEIGIISVRTDRLAVYEVAAIREPVLALNFVVENTKHQLV
jgi:hypothetical protein